MTALASGISSVVQFITVLLIFLFVLAITYFTTRFVGNFQKSQQSGSNIKIVETARIAPNKFIQIVSVADRYFALVVCKDTVTTITEIDKDSLVLPESSGEKISFKDFLNKAKCREEEKD